jgi:hypothetical protein
MSFTDVVGCLGRSRTTRVVFVNESTFAIFSESVETKLIFTFLQKRGKERGKTQVLRGKDRNTH